MKKPKKLLYPNRAPLNAEPWMFHADVWKLIKAERDRLRGIVRSLMPRTTIGSHNYARKEVLKGILTALKGKP